MLPCWKMLSTPNIWTGVCILVFNKSIMSRYKMHSKWPHYLSWWKTPWNIFRSIWVCVGRPPAVQWSKQCGLPSHTQSVEQGGGGEVEGRTKHWTAWSDSVNTVIHPSWAERREGKQGDAAMSWQHRRRSHSELFSHQRFRLKISRRIGLV